MARWHWPSPEVGTSHQACYTVDSGSDCASFSFCLCVVACNLPAIQTQTRGRTIAGAGFRPRARVCSLVKSILRPARLPLQAPPRAQPQLQQPGSSRQCSVRHVAVASAAAAASASDAACLPDGDGGILGRAAALAMLLWQHALTKMAAVAKRLHQPLEQEVTG